MPVAALAEARLREPYARRLAGRATGLRPARVVPAPTDYDAASSSWSAPAALASKEWAFRQYDQQGRHQHARLAGSMQRAAVKGTRRAIAIAIAATGGRCSSTLGGRRPGRVRGRAQRPPAQGGHGRSASPTPELRLPERPEILWQLAEAVEGIGEACRALELPVVGGNVSFYNETLGQAILPTPIVGVVGLLDDATLLSTQWFKAAGHRVALLGPERVSLGGSEYLHVRHDQVGGRLAPLDLEIERRVQAAVRAAIGAVDSATRLLQGGVAAALAGACVSVGRRSVRGDAGGGAAGDHVLCGEGPSRGVVSVETGRAREFEALMAESAIPWRLIGTTGGDRLRLSVGTETVVDVGLDQIEHAWRNGFERHMA